MKGRKLRCDLPQLRYRISVLRPLHPLFPPRFCLSLATLSLSDDCWAAAALGQVLRLSLVSSPATSTHQVLPHLLFPSLMLCEAEHRNPNLKLFSYLTSLLTSKFLQKLLGVHVYTHVPLLDPPLIGASSSVL